MNYNQVPSPCFVLDETRLRRNLALIRSVKERAGVEIILAFKAFAMWSVFPVIKEYISCTTASSPAEARLAFEEMGTRAHTYAPAYTDREFPEIAAYSSHITFNSPAQFEKFKDFKISRFQDSKIQNSFGLRINPEVSVVETDLYNPAKAGSRLGITASRLPSRLPEGIEGLHFHVLCESSSYDLEKVLAAVEAKFGKYLAQIQWLNMGGGHLMTRADYDTEHLIALLKAFRSRHPHLQIILEPGAAFVWQTGELVATVQDVVENHGIKTAMLDVSFACHMPDCLEMPYQPEILYQNKEQRAKSKEQRIKSKEQSPDSYREKNKDNYILAKKLTTDHPPLTTNHSPLTTYHLPLTTNHCYRLGGNSCLSGDYVGDWAFDRELQAGDRIVFLDMMHYTTVKTTMFNGVSHPALALWTKKAELRVVREFGYEDYKNRLS